MRLQALAAGDIRKACAWFNAREAGLGDHFFERVNDIVLRIAENPEQYPQVIGNARRAPVHGFHHSVWYRLDPDHSVVIACLSDRQDLSIARRRALRTVDPI